MNHENQRIYVGNLPFDITETEVLTKFSKYGNVVKVEMKYRSDPYSDVGLPCYAFLEMQIDSSKIDRCFRKVSSKKWKGHSVKLELAKESFLSRLEKERQETTSKTTTAPVEVKPVDASDVPREKKDTQLKKNTPMAVNGPIKGSKRVRLDADTPANDCQDNLGSGASVIQKFESFSDVWKDLPAYQLNVNYGQVGESGKSKKAKQSNKKVSDKKGLSEFKRLKSLEDKKKSFFLQKEAVKLALSAVDSHRTSNKRIVFDEDYKDVFVPTTSTANQSIPKVSGAERKHESPVYTKPLFIEENESADEEKEAIDFKIKRQFEGKKGQKLLELQSQYASDKRFTLDERFYDSDDRADEDGAVDSDDHADEDGTGDSKISTNDEVKRQLEILQNIVGHELAPILDRKNTPKDTNNFMLRFDPTNADHAKYEIKETETKPVSLPQSKTGQKKTEKKKKEKHTPECSVTTSQVSKDTFYKVSETLTESLKTKESGAFSLLKMFGSVNENDIEVVDKEVEPSKSVPLSKSSMDWLSNPFTHDSSESESEEAIPQSKPDVPDVGTSQACGLWRETFFFKTNDARLSEGLAFFSNKNDNEENFSQRRRELKHIVTAKVKHNLRKSQPKKKKLGGTQFNRFRDTKNKKRVGGSKLKKFRKK